MTLALTPIATVGRSTLALLATIGRVAIYAGLTLSHLIRPPFYIREFFNALMTIGYFSLPVVGLTTLFHRRRAGAADLLWRLAL